MLSAMLPRSFFRWSLLTLATVGLGACGGGAVRHRMEPPTFQARIAQFAGADGNSVTLRLELQEYNPNGYELYARELNANMSIAGQTIAIAHANFVQVLPPQAPLPVVTNVMIPRASIAGGVPMNPATMSAMPAALPFAISGSVRIEGRRARRFFDVPFNVQGVVSREVFLGLMAGVAPAGATPQPMAVQPSAGGQMVGGPSDSN